MYCDTLFGNLRSLAQTLCIYYCTKSPTAVLFLSMQCFMRVLDDLRAVVCFLYSILRSTSDGQ
jgi:hypothetical protein